MDTQSFQSENLRQPEKPVTHRAQWVMVDPDTILQDGYVVVQGGFIVEIGQGSKSIDGPIIDHDQGVLMPALVNAHTHLELCVLKGSVDTRSGFQNWVRSLLLQREGFSSETLCEQASSGIQSVLQTGTIAIADIATLGFTRDLFLQSPLMGVWFQELIGNHPTQGLCCRKGPRQSTSLAGHAPHTTSPEFLSRLKNITRKGKVPFSIHLAESEEEAAFIAEGSGAWANFLKERKIDFSFWGVGQGRTPVQHADCIGLLDEHTIVVHLVQILDTDMEILASQRPYVCLCPRSNLALHGRLPNVPAMLEKKLPLCIGTDSLACVDSLSVMDEIRCLADQYQELPPASLLAMATRNGAAALGLDGMVGTLRPGNSDAFLYMELKAANALQLMEAIVFEGCQAPIHWIDESIMVADQLSEGGQE